jgi:hypothetical protein
MLLLKIIESILKGTFSFEFEYIGKYTFQSSQYAWMKGIVDVIKNF